MALDEDKLEALRSWGERLRQGGGEESAAVGRAILMLIDEIDRLHIELWHASLDPPEDGPVSTTTTGASEEEPVASGLHARLQRVLRRDSATPESPAEGASETEGDTTSPQAWIEALRRQK